MYGNEECQKKYGPEYKKMVLNARQTNVNNYNSRHQAEINEKQNLTSSADNVCLVSTGTDLAMTCTLGTISKKVSLLQSHFCDICGEYCNTLEACLLYTSPSPRDS